MNTHPLSPFPCTNSISICQGSRLLRNPLQGIRHYLAARVDYEPNPYYKGRYTVALTTCDGAGKGLPDPYTVAEILFRDSRLAGKIQGWLEDRSERFPYLSIKFDGSLGDWKEPNFDRASLPPKKPVQSASPDSNSQACPGKRVARSATRGDFPRRVNTV